MRMEFATSCPVSIFIAGDYDKARESCRAFCDEVGLCVTVTPTTYVYTDGEEAGVIVGLINYPRFPSEQVLIEDKAIQLGMKLREDLGQESFSVQTPTTTTWFSWRADDLAIAAGTRSAETSETSAPSEGCQSGPKGIAPTTPLNHPRST